MKYGDQPGRELHTGNLTSDNFVHNLFLIFFLKGLGKEEGGKGVEIETPTTRDNESHTFIIITKTSPW